MDFGLHRGSCFVNLLLLSTANKAHNGDGKTEEQLDREANGAKQVECSCKFGAATLFAGEGDPAD